MNRPAKSFRDLIVWQKAHEFVLRTYKLTEQFPRHERYCLTPQVRRAAISIPANIAEGFRKRGFLDKNRFFNTSQGSLEECRYYLILGEDLGYGECTAWNRSLRTFPVCSSPTLKPSRQWYSKATLKKEANNFPNLSEPLGNAFRCLLRLA